MIYPALKWIGNSSGFLELIDQRLLPGRFVKLKCRDTDKLYDAIKTLAVRGAPAIGVAAGYGCVLTMQKLKPDTDVKEAIKQLDKECEFLKSCRPTAVNLYWALERIKQVAYRHVESKNSATFETLREVVFKEANLICSEDIDMCLKIGQNGSKYIKNGSAVLTHCNAGALATAGQGTALSVIYEAQKAGKEFKVYVDETRPLLQGARLTTWELQQAGVDATLICDNMSGWLMKQGKIDVVITGADRIAANGDAANKIGTYSLSVLASHNNIPFYIAAPSSTFDMNIKSGKEIPIEQRSDGEVTGFAETKVAPEGIKVYNPAFDVVDAGNITAIITEKAVIENPSLETISAIMDK